MQLLEGFLDNGILKGSLKFKTYDIFDIIRYDLLFSVEEYIHPYWVLANVVKDYQIDEFHYYSDKATSYEHHLQVQDRTVNIQHSFSLNDFKRSGNDTGICKMNITDFSFSCL